MDLKSLTSLSVIPLENLGTLDSPAEAAGLKVISTGCIKQVCLFVNNKICKNIL